MCGILGELSWSRPVERQTFEAALDELTMRGRDGRGVEFRDDGRVALGHQRLAIVDLSDAAAQPMTNEDRTVWLTYNGEIYNHLELRRELEALGHRFRSRTDSEVVVHGWEEWGPGCTERFEGIFAFGLWDENKRQLFLARDHLGVKPLYFWHHDGGLAFASQPRAILQHPRFQPRLDLEAFRTYMLLGYVAVDECIFAGMRKLAPAHRLLAADNRVTVERYWDVPVAPTIRDPEQATEAIAAQLERSVKEQLMSDVPVGVFLSGGIDSSTVTSIAHRFSARPIHAFTVGFHEENKDERAWARLIVDDLGLSQTERVLDYETAVSMLEEVTNTWDEPFGGGSAFPTAFVSAMADGCDYKVVLAGDGGDELFAGYTRYDEYRSRCEQGVPDPAAAYAELPTMQRISPQQMESVLTAECRASLDPDPYRLFRRFFRPELPPVAAAQLMDLGIYLPDHILFKVDRASMANGVEARVPLCDRRLVELAFTIDHDVLFAGGERKALLKRAAARWVPTAVLTARKKGFSIPLGPWMVRGIAVLGRGLLRDGVLMSLGVLEREATMELYAGKRKAITWQLLAVELWARRWLAGQAIETFLDPERLALASAAR